MDQPQMMVVPDVEDAFVPMQEDFFVDPQESRFESISNQVNRQITNRPPSLTNRVNVF